MKKNLILAALAALLQWNLSATQVEFPLLQMFGGTNYTTPFRVDAVSPTMTDGTNFWVGSFKTVIPTGGANPIVELTPNDYLVSFREARTAWRIHVPNTTNVLNAISQTTGALPSFWWSPNTINLTQVINQYGTNYYSGDYSITNWVASSSNYYDPATLTFFYNTNLTVGSGPLDTNAVISIVGGVLNTNPIPAANIVGTVASSTTALSGWPTQWPVSSLTNSGTMTYSNAAAYLTYLQGQFIGSVAASASAWLTWSGDGTPGNPLSAAVTDAVNTNNASTISSGTLNNSRLNSSVMVSPRSSTSTLGNVTAYSPAASTMYGFIGNFLGLSVTNSFPPILIQTPAGPADIIEFISDTSTNSWLDRSGYWHAAAFYQNGGSTYFDTTGFHGNGSSLTGLTVSQLTDVGNLAYTNASSYKTYLDGLYQPLNANLTAFAGLIGAADKLPYFTGSGTMGFMTIGSGLSLSSGTLSATGGGGGTPVTNFVAFIYGTNAPFSSIQYTTNNGLVTAWFGTNNVVLTNSAFAADVWVTTPGVTNFMLMGPDTNTIKVAASNVVAGVAAGSNISASTNYNVNGQPIVTFSAGAGGVALNLPAGMTNFYGSAGSYWYSNTITHTWLKVDTNMVSSSYLTGNTVVNPLTTGVFWTATNYGTLRVSLWATNARAILTNVTTGEGYVLGQTGWTNFIQASLGCKPGDSVGVTNITSAAAPALKASYFYISQ